jgi:SAM-dependent methyltransferase
MAPRREAAIETKHHAGWRKALKRVPGVMPAWRSLRGYLVGRMEPREVWRDANPGEVEFWRRELPGRIATLPDYQRRVDPEGPVTDPVLKYLLARIPETTISMIDVGAGPLTAVGKAHPGKTLNITATDPLAGEYVRIMQEAGIEPPVPPVACRGEDLLDTFEPNSFDIAFARNAVDHSFDPQRVITNMVHLVKEGRFVVLRHIPREGERNSYRGLHQWNFDIEDGDFVIWRPRGPKVHMDRKLEDIASLACFHDSSGWMVCVITKHGGTGGRRPTR